MRRLIPLLLLVMPVTVLAQGHWYGHFTTGINASEVIFTESGVIQYPVSFVDFMMGLSLCKDYKKHWQIGAGIETGMLQQDLYGYATINTGTEETQVAYVARYNILAPAVGVMAFAHYKLKMPRGHYLFGGPALGVMGGGNSLEGATRNSIVPMAGANVGIALRVRDGVYFTVMHGYRIGYLKHHADIVNISPDPNMIGGRIGSSGYYKMSDAIVQYIYTSVGLLVRL